MSKRLYSYVDGLPGREVTCAVQDKLGYMWFGTKNGLCRFDGKNFRVFTEKKSGLYYNQIRELFSDNNNGIIISYSSKRNMYVERISSLDVININTLQVSSFNDYYRDCPFKQEDIGWIGNSQDGVSISFFLKPFYVNNINTFKNIKSATLDSTGKFKKADLKIIRTATLSSKGKISVSGNFNESSSVADRNIYLLSNGSFLCCHEPSNFGLKLYQEKDGTIFLLKNWLICDAICRMANTGQVISLDSTGGLYGKFRFTRDADYLQAPGDDYGVSINRKNNFISFYEPANGVVQITDSLDPEPIRRARVLTVYKNRNGQRWLCTTEGIVKVILKKRKFFRHFTFRQNPVSSNHSTRSILFDGQKIYAALYDFIAIENEKQFDRIVCTENYSLLKRDSILWVGSRYLSKYNLRTKKLIGDKMHSNFGEIWSLFALNESQIIAGTSEKLILYDELQDTSREVKYAPYDKPNLIYRIFRNSRSEILAVADNGIYVLNDHADVTDCFSFQSKNKLPFEHINDVYEDNENPGMYWVATAGDGLYSWSRVNNKFERFGIDNGFLSETLYRIEPDSFGNLWISTEFGLARFNKKSSTVRIFTEPDGIAHNEFNRGSSTRSSDGMLGFGGIDGITTFNPRDFIDEIESANYQFEVVSVSQYDAKKNTVDDITREFRTRKRLVLTNTRRNASLKVTLLDYEERSHLYAYQIEGYNFEWNYTNEGIIELKGLPFGDFALNIKAQNPDGTWNKTSITIPVEVIKPFYLTWWFILTLICVCIVIVAGLIKYRTKRLQIEKLRLEGIVSTRTNELENSLNEKTALLQELHHRVKNNLQFVSSLINMQINTSNSDVEIYSLNDTSRRIGAIALIHEMLYNQTDVKGVDINNYLSELISTINELINKEQLPIKFNISLGNLFLKIDIAIALGIITSELISNSIKYAFNNVEKPEITVLLVKANDSGTIVFSVKDNGSGIELKSDMDRKKLGMRLIDIFSRQIKGVYAFENCDGLKFELKFEA